ncbi:MULTISPECIES: folylpolyglutamate synthase/dihydrofolate synthase family protein [unclassified Pseudoxanthomonas]|uniref:bifunctional folylpolyglutamate synthase/dihydrofolate synthase n=1 Tax=unclassified Pseudoxanthomonas TaxID=2645906 RepID=UPI003078A54E
MNRDLNSWLAYIEQQHPKSIDMGLERVREVASRMCLEKPAKHVITVGGTNGKGSTVAFIESIACEAGWRVGTYTSPHLLRYNERVRIDGREATDEELVEAFEVVEAARLSPSPSGRGVGERVRRRLDNTGDADACAPRSGVFDVAGAEAVLEAKAVQLTYFEFGTLAALWLFQRAELDLAVLEVGLGGRLDAVNLVDPDVAVITTVDIDHTDWLGEDREKIGYEKAGIARAWKPLVLGEIDSPSSVLRHAYAIGANAIRLGSDFFHEPIDQDHWRWREVGAELTLPNPTLAAPIQRANAATAIAALRALDAVFPESAFASGVAAARLPGRLQRFQHAGVEVVVDVGHNPQAARELNAWLQTQAGEGETRAVFAALSDKDVVGVVAAFEENIRHWYLAGLEEGRARGQDAEALATRLSGTAAANGVRHVNVRQALQAAITASQPGDRVLVFGSFHTAAEALVSLHSVP